MSKKLSKVMIAILAAVMAFCFCIAMASTTTAKADVADCKIEMVDKVQVRQTGEMGIRFNATISAADYDALTAAGAEFGMILAPADWLTSDAELSFYSTTLVEYDGTQGATDKFFAKGTNVPVQDVTDIDGDNDITEYVLTCSFIKIKDTNFDRDFVARAYFKVGADYYESETVVERNIYTVASKALIGGDVEDDVVTDYLADIVGKVATEDSTLNVVVNGDVANKGDKFTVTATLTTAKNKVVETGVALSVERDGDIVVDGLSFDATTGEYTVNTAGKLTLVAKAGGKTVDVKELSIKRDDVTFNLIPGRRSSTGSGVVFTPLVDTDNVLYSDFGYNVNDNVHRTGSSIVLTYELEDALKADSPDVKFTIESDTAWLKEIRDGSVYLAAVASAGIPATDSIVTGTYTDVDGMTYTDSFKISGHTLAEGYNETAYSTYSYTNDDKTVSFNQISTYISNETSVLIKNVPLTTSHDADVIRLTYPNWDESTKTQIARMSVRFVDVNDPNNWVEVLVGRHASAPSNQILGVNTSAWESKLAGKSRTAMYYSTRYSELYLHNDTQLDLGVHAMDFTRFNTLNTFDVYGDAYYYHMGGFSVVNDEVCFNTISSGARTNVTIFTKEQQATELLANDAVKDLDLSVWSGFTDKGVTNVNVIISVARIVTPEGAQYEEQRLLIDTLGGRAVTAEDASKFVYISKVS